MASNSKITFRTIIFVSFMLISVVPLMLLAYWVQHSVLENEIDAVQEKHLLIAKNLKNSLDRYVYDIEVAFDVISMNSHSSKENVKVFQLLKRLGYRYVWHKKEGHEELLFDHTESAQNIKMPDSILSHLKKSQLSKKYRKNKINISGIVSGVSSNSADVNVFLISQEFTNGEFLIASIGTEYIRSLQSKVEFGKRGHAAIVDQYGKVMAHPVTKWHETRKDISFLPPVQKMMSGETGVTQFYTPAMSADMIAGHTVVDSTGWGVMIPQPFAELTENASYLQFAVFILALVGLFVSGITSWWLSGYITRALNDVISFTENIASGEFDTHVSVDKGIMPVELQKLIESFNRMVDKIKSKTNDSIILTDRLREAQKMAKLGSWKLNITDNTMWWSEEVYNILDLDKNNIASPTLDTFVSAMEEDQKNIFLDLIKKSILTQKPFSVDSTLTSNNGDVFYVHQDIVVQKDVSENLVCISGTMQDVTDRKKQEDALYRQANFDSLTNLPNRQACLDFLDAALPVARDENRILPFFLIGLDHFQEVNGSLGHNAGDKLLVMAGERLRECIRSHDYVARLGGDEFAVVLLDVSSSDIVSSIAQNIVDEFQKPFTVDYYEVFVGVSIGISIYPENDALNPLLLLQKADMALHAAKVDGRGTFNIFTSLMDEQVNTRMNLRSDLPIAIEDKEFHLVFQPIVDSHTGKVICAESLIRWIHPTKGFIPPDKFISIAEESGYIGEIGLWVLEEACKELKNWHNNGYPELYISVNLSLRQIQLGLTKEMILDILQKNDLSPEFLTLEVTESLLMEDLDRNLKWLNDVRETGIRFSIDDFGTGYSSLSYLLNLPVSTLKIDRAFIMNILENPKDDTLVEMIVTLSKRLGFKIVAEGVETEGQLNKLIEYDCDLIQGYYFSRPLKSPEFMEYLQENNKKDNVLNIVSKK